MKQTFFFRSLLLIGLLTSALLHADTQPKIQLALLLDTSNSMDGLIDQAKSQLWKVVNEFALAKQNGQSPQLEIALYEYGNDGLVREEGYLRQVAPLTGDLDLISEQLFQLTTNGGSEYCGWVIRSASSDLKWDESPDVLKVIFIAGNEPFTQGKVDYANICREAISKGIIVNTIFCGDFQEGINTQWKRGADLADGKYMNIDQDKTIVHVDAPQDSIINRLNNQLNDTYLFYGKKRSYYAERQRTQDKNASSFGAANAAQRAISKSSGNYKNSGWDLVDAVEDGEVSLEEVAEDELPEEMKQLSKEEREALIKKQAAKRKEIKQRIQELSNSRRAYIAKKRKELSEEQTLEDAIIQTVRQQAISKSYQFE